MPFPVVGERLSVDSTAGSGKWSNFLATYFQIFAGWTRVMADTGSQVGDVGDPGSSHEDEMVVEETGEARSLSPTEEETAPVNSGSGQNVSDDESLGLSIQEVSLHDPTGAAEDMEGRPFCFLEKDGPGGE